jgi:hypothetical protein
MELQSLVRGQLLYASGEAISEVISLLLHPHRQQCHNMDTRAKPSRCEDVTQCNTDPVDVVSLPPLRVSAE